ncbi:hypothetical protein P3T76_003708 [Phytophthora citrophthora]|uniref:EF-hand domain-containing protein n=1 Tax=Phytophthora citrophthora TaxID=4793 RepID=A0AAD9GUJ6_9STRA|nr:hypothetical protein P3T76_003708 [Phytophthora citrophthora]
MESLDASYALLSDVNARNRALQARLNSSLPLLWKNNALVMTSAVGPRRRRAVFAESEQSEADQMLLALEDQTNLQVSRRYKRRVEWEVARRIARVDRELQQYPPAQRFWNQRRKESPLFNRQRVDRVRRVGSRDTVGKVGGVKTGKQVVERIQKKISDVNQHGKTSWTKPNIVMEPGEERMVKHAATSPLRVPVDVTDNKENAVPNAVPNGDKFEMKFKARDEEETFEDEPQYDRSAIMKTVGENDLGDTAIAVEAGTDNKSPSTRPAESNPDSPARSLKSSAGDIFSKQRNSIPDVHQEQEGEDTFILEDESSRPINTPAEERPSSSIGRQVLSDFRTMPSVASFGAPPILSGATGNPGRVRLNVDVLRRLFSDLDTDKDGHINRIEACMALHRLQIPVPTTRIISFFRTVHSSSNGKPGQRMQHLPMKEVINYKEFVAFTTAAYDQQQHRQTQQRRARIPRKESYGRDPKLSVPSTSLPIYTHPITSSNAKRSVDPSFSRRQNVRVYEANESELEQGNPTVEDRVLKEIPEFLISRILAESPSTEVKENAASAVRKSVELVLGESVDDKIVNEITQELLRHRLHNIGALDEFDDVTGLKRAEAYYNDQTMKGDIDSVVDELDSEGFVNWVDVLTEEQVSGLVQQFWKLKPPSIHQSSLVEDVPTENSIEQNPPVKLIDEATDTNELVVSTELPSKAVQAFDEKQREGPPSPLEDIDATIPELNQADSLPAIVAMPDPEYLSQTYFGKSLSNVLGGFGSKEFYEPATSISILQRLRQQRRVHQRMFNNQQRLSYTDEPVLWSLGSSTSIRDRLDGESLFSSERNSGSVSARSVEQDHHQLEPEMRNPEPLPARVPSTITNVLDFNDSVSSLGAAKSISVSSSISSASGHHHVYGMHREIDRYQLHSRSRSIRRPYRRANHLSVSGSSVPDSICSAELSEGELSGEEALNLSDGEIFGEIKNKIVRHKRRALDSKDEDENLHNSIESGEIPAVVSLATLIWCSLQPYTTQNTNVPFLNT